jgi:hypothetical protein
MNLSKPHPQPLPESGRGGRPRFLGASVFHPLQLEGVGGRQYKTLTMKKLLRFFIITATIAMVLALYSFANDLLCEAAMVNFETTVNAIYSTLIGLVCVAFISLTIMFFMEEL